MAQTEFAGGVRLDSEGGVEIAAKLFTPGPQRDECRIGLVVFHGEGCEDQDRAWHISISQAKELVARLQQQVERAEEWARHTQR